MDVAAGRPSKMGSVEVELSEASCSEGLGSVKDLVRGVSAGWSASRALR